MEDETRWKVRTRNQQAIHARSAAGVLLTAFGALLCVLTVMCACDAVVVLR